MSRFSGFGLLCALALTLAGCAETSQPLAPQGGPAVFDGSPAGAARGFAQVIRRMEPVAERECLARRVQPVSCDFQFVVDDTPGREPNGFQTLDRQGRPVIGFTLALIAQTQNPDEMAFVLGHEVSHHILGHLRRRESAATAGSVILGGLASAYGADAAGVLSAQEAGAEVGARYYSQDWELEADYLGAIIATKAGYDAQRGAQLLARLPDPGNHMLGSHPPRAVRLANIAQAIADYRSGRFR